MIELYELCYKLVLSSPSYLRDFFDLEFMYEEMVGGGGEEFTIKDKPKQQYCSNVATLLHIAAMFHAMWEVIAVVNEYLEDLAKSTLLVE